MAAAAASLALLPRSADAAWARVASMAPGDKFFSRDQAALITVMQEVLIPRTDTPGARDVGVSDFIHVIVAEFYDDGERSAFLGGLEAIDVLSREIGGAAFAELDALQRRRVMTALEQPADGAAPAARTYVRLKGLVVHGYFTSARVQQDVLKTVIAHRTFDGAAPMRIRDGGSR